MADVSRGPSRLCFFVHLFALFVTYFCTYFVSYDQKKLLDVRTVITHWGLAESFFFFHDSDEPKAEDIQLPREQAPTPVIWVKRRRRKRERRVCCLLRSRRQSNKPPLPTILLANMQSLDNNMDELLGILNYQWDIKICNILCFTHAWLNDDNIT